MERRERDHLPSRPQGCPGLPQMASAETEDAAIMAAMIEVANFMLFSEWKIALKYFYL